MKTKYLLVAFVVLFLVFVCIWILSPRVGEKVDINEGIDVSFGENDDEIPKDLPPGYVRDKNYTDGVVYKKIDGDKTSYFEYVGNGQFIHYDVNKPPYFVKTTFDRRIYQVRDINGKLTDEYRALDSNGIWQVVDNEYKQIFNIDSTHKPSNVTPNLYRIEKKDGELKTYDYKLLTKIGDTYAWTSPVVTENWIEVEIPQNFSKTEIVNVYSAKDGENTIYKRVLSFNDVYKSIAVVDCDNEGKFI